MLLLTQIDHHLINNMQIFRKEVKKKKKDTLGGVKISKSQFMYSLPPHSAVSAPAGRLAVVDFNSRERRGQLELS